MNNASLGAIDVCIDSHDGNGLVPFFTNVPATTPPTTSFQDSNELTAVQGAQVYVGSSGGDCSTFQNFTLNFPAGTNTVFTATNSGASVPGDQPSCGEACFQVLFVGEDTHPNNPNTEVFCANIANLAGVQSGLKELVGDVDPTDETTIANTQPSAGDMQAFIESTNAALTLGDATVPPIVAAVVGDRDCGSACADPHVPVGGLRPVGTAAFGGGADRAGRERHQAAGRSRGHRRGGCTGSADRLLHQRVCSVDAASDPTTTTTPAPTPVAANAKFTG